MDASLVPDESKEFITRRREPEQASLFPATDLVIPGSLQNWKKSVAAIHAVPLKAEHSQTLNLRRLIDGCIIVAQLDIRRREAGAIERIKAERITPVFEVRITDLARLSGISGKNYQRIYDDLDVLYDMDLEWNIVGEDGEVEWRARHHFFASRGFGEGAKAGLVRFEFPHDVLLFVLEPKYWASLSLQVQHALGTSASYALYQNTWRYINTAQKVTAALPVDVWVQLLCGQSRYLKEEGGEVVVNYKDFKRYVLMDAVERVNSVAALGYRLELIEHKKGRRVSKLQFKFVEKSGQLELPTVWPSDVMMTLKALGHSRQEIHDLSEAHSLAEVSDALLRLKDAGERLKTKGKKISSGKDYFRGILANISSGVRPEELDHEKIQAEVQRQTSERDAVERRKRIEAEFAQHLNERFVEWLGDLSEGDREQLFDRFIATERGRAFRSSRARWQSASSVFSAGLRAWMKTEQPGMLAEALSRPEDKSIEGWMAWKLDGGGAIEASG
jgi:plasmid replication initiation protein